MKKSFIYALLSATSLVGTIGFSACSSDEKLAAEETNPDYNPATNEVAAQFVFSVSTSSSQTTRMSAQDVQYNVSSATDFRGIENAEILTVKNSLGDGKIMASAGKASKQFSFGTVINPGKLDPTSGSATSDVTKSHRIMELSLPTETNTMLFYGKAVKTGTNNAQGSITWNVDTVLSNTSFSLNRIVPATGEAKFKQYETLISTVLTNIINAKVASGTEITFGSSSVILPKDLKWSDFVEVSSSNALTTNPKAPLNPAEPMCALGEVLGNAFATLNNIYSGELRAGSASAISYLINDLSGVIDPIISATPISLPEAVAQEVAKAVKTEINKYFTGADYSWKSVADVKSAVNLTTAETNLIDNTSDLNLFPTDFGLPYGSIILTVVIEGSESAGYTFKYAYKDAIPTYAMGDVGNFNPYNYTYPAELCYFGNSPLRVNNDKIAASGYPDGVTDWDNDGKWGTGWQKNSHILSSTRSVAMQNNVNYATAMLETTVSYATDILEDNNKTIQHARTGADEDNNKINVGSNDSYFQLTGILIGGQEPEVGWNYLAKAESPKYDCMVYDNCGAIDIPHALNTSGGNTSAPVYTLVWDNWEQSKLNTDQRTVYVALEFINNGNDFWGEYNMIREKGKFYLVGKLDPDEASATTLSNLGIDATAYKNDKSKGISWPTTYAIPPYDERGNTIKERRIFMQDFKTIANFKIGKTSLQKAMVTVPDLRSGQISLGLSVDLQWKSGLEYDVVLGE